MFDFVVAILVFFVIGFVLKKLYDKFGSPVRTRIGQKIAAVREQADD